MPRSSSASSQSSTAGPETKQSRTEHGSDQQQAGQPQEFSDRHARTQLRRKGMCRRVYIHVSSSLHSKTGV